MVVMGAHRPSHVTAVLKAHPMLRRVTIMKCCTWRIRACSQTAWAHAERHRCMAAGRASLAAHLSQHYPILRATPQPQDTFTSTCCTRLKHSKCMPSHFCGTRTRSHQKGRTAPNHHTCPLLHNSHLQHIARAKRLGRVLARIVVRERRPHGVQGEQHVGEENGHTHRCIGAHAAAGPAQPMRTYLPTSVEGRTERRPTQRDGCGACCACQS